jgi:hypothetical protein
VHVVAEGVVEGEARVGWDGLVGHGGSIARERFVGRIVGGGGADVELA